MTKQNKEETEIDILENDVSKFSALEVMAKTDGAEMLRKALVTDLIRTIEIMGNNAKTLTHTEYIALGCAVKEKMSLLKIITTSSSKKEQAKKYLAEKLEGNTES